MRTKYSAELNVQILIALMKAHGVKKVVISPGATNVCLAASLQYDSYFELFSAADERSAAYIACGLAAESKSPVALSCTQATASRNYLPALTEAFYRKLPILAITSTRAEEEVGHRLQQVIDRSVLPKDTVRLSVSLPMIHTQKEKWACEVNANRALLELTRHGGGPVHINLGTEYTEDFSVETLPPVRVIHRRSSLNDMPELVPGKIGIFVASHLVWDDLLTTTVDEFCEKYDAVVLCDHTSNYSGKYGIMERLVTSQALVAPTCNCFSTLIHIGNMSGSYLKFHTDKVWRVSLDGEICDPFEKLTEVFEMDECDFFQYYVGCAAEKVETVVYHEWRECYDRLELKAKQRSAELPFSNVWIAQQTLPRLPKNAVLHLGIYNTLRTWSLFEKDQSIQGFSNVGGFGIDGNLSSLLGASLFNSEKLYFGIVGDLSFFYDMNALGNRHMGKNLRLLVVNNGRGTEFRLKDNFTYSAGVDEAAVSYIAAEGHYGRQSKVLLRHYAEDLGLKYFSASNKQEFQKVIGIFTDATIGDCSMVFEVFTDSDDERDALDIMYTLADSLSNRMKQTAKGILGEKGVRLVKKVIHG